MPEFEVERLGDGLYSITSSFSKDKPIWVTAQEMRDLYDYALLHMAEIEKEAVKMNRLAEKRKQKQRDDDGWSDKLADRGY